MKFDLAALIRRLKNPRRPTINLPTITPRKAQVNGLAAIYLRMVRAIADEVREKLFPAYVQAVGADAIAGVTAGQLAQQAESINDSIRRLVLNLTPEMNDWIVRAETIHRSQWTAGVLTATGVDITTLVGPEDVREALGVVLARNVALVRDVGQQAQGRIADIVFRGFQSRTPPRTVAKELNEAVGLGRKRALRIAAHQAQALSATMDRERATAAGLAEFTWRHSRKLHPRPEHVERDGHAYRYNDPSLAGDMPGDKIHCGCKSQALLRFD